MKSALLPGGKGASGEKDGGLRSFVQGTRKEIFSYKPHLLRLLGSGGNGLAGCSERQHEWRLRLKPTIPATAMSLPRPAGHQRRKPPTARVNNSEKRVVDLTVA